jgi:hypothetical protein
MKNMVAPTFRSAGAELKLSATTRHHPGRRPRGHFSSTCCSVPSGAKSPENLLFSGGQQVRSRKRKRKIMAPPRNLWVKGR